jgi:pentatricopeptide repeat protein
LDDISDKLVVVADAHWHKGEYNHIVNLTRIILAARPDLVDLYANAGWLLWSMDRDDEAIALYKQGVQANPNQYYMYDELGQYYLTRKKDYPTAVSYYEKAVKFADVRPQTWNALARAYEKSGQMEKAYTAWQKAATYPNNIAAKPNLERVRRLIKQ